MIIILNGTSSSGKSSIALEIHKLSEEPFLIFCMDSFFSMLSPRYDGLVIDHKNSRSNDTLKGFYSSDIPSGYRIEAGELGNKLSLALPRAIAASASVGLNFVVPVVITSKLELDEYRNALKNIPTYVFFIECSEQEIIRRENNRDDRLRGSAVDLLNRMETKEIFDASINTEKNDPSSIASYLLEYCHNNKPKIFI